MGGTYPSWASSVGPMSRPTFPCSPLTLSLPGPRLSVAPPVCTGHPDYLYPVDWPSPDSWRFTRRVGKGWALEESRTVRVVAEGHGGVHHKFRKLHARKCALPVYRLWDDDEDEMPTR